MQKQEALFSVHTSKHPSFALYCDGASRGNPGEAGTGIYITEHAVPIIQKGFYIGQKTNNQAEYLALAIGLLLFRHWCQEHAIEHPKLAIFADSELMIRQMTGAYKTKNETIQHIRKLIDKTLIGITYTCTHVLREQNKHADLLANQGIDKKNKIPTEISKNLSNYGLL
jgi:ribonuclease HI